MQHHDNIIKCCLGYIFWPGVGVGGRIFYLHSKTFRSMCWLHNTSNVYSSLFTNDPSFSSRNMCNVSISYRDAPKFSSFAFLGRWKSFSYSHSWLHVHSASVIWEWLLSPCTPSFMPVAILHSSGTSNVEDGMRSIHSGKQHYRADARRGSSNISKRGAFLKKWMGMYNHVLLGFIYWLFIYSFDLYTAFLGPKAFSNGSISVAPLLCWNKNWGQTRKANLLSGLSR